MIFAFVSLRAGTVGGLPNRNSKRLFSRTSNGISKKAVRFSLEVGRCRKAPRHQLFSEFFAKAIKMSGQFVYGGGFQVLLSSHKIPQGIGKRWHSKSGALSHSPGSNKEQRNRPKHILRPFLCSCLHSCMYHASFVCSPKLSRSDWYTARASLCGCRTESRTSGSGAGTRGT